MPESLAFSARPPALPSAASVRVGIARTREKDSGTCWAGQPPPKLLSIKLGGVGCRMNSVRRSSMFDRPQLKTISLTRTSAGYGLELQGSSPPIIAQVCKFT